MYCLIGHTQCGVNNLESKKEQFIKGLSEGAGWRRQEAEEHFEIESPIFSIKDEIEFILSESKRLSLRYPKILVAPFLYRVKERVIFVGFKNNEKENDAA